MIGWWAAPTILEHGSDDLAAVAAGGLSDLARLALLPWAGLVEGAALGAAQAVAPSLGIEAFPSRIENDAADIERAITAIASLAPLVPDAPPTLAMTTVSPMCFCNCGAKGRKMLSVSPPAGHGTISLIGRSGHSAKADETGAAVATKTAAVTIARREPSRTWALAAMVLQATCAPNCFAA